MQILTNETLVNRNRKIATFLFFFSMIILGLGFLMANTNLLGISATDESSSTSAYLIIMPMILLIGFISTLISVRMTNLWLRIPRPEDVLRENLKGLSNKSRLYNYYHLPARHVLICPQGVFAIITRFQDGKFVVEGDKWKARRSIFGRLFGFFRMDDLGNPAQEAQEAAAYVRHITEDYDPELAIQPIVIFTSPKAELEIKEATVPVFYADSKSFPNFRDYLKDRQKMGDMQGPKDIEGFIAEFEAATLEY